VPTAERSAAEAAQLIANAFEAGGVSYAIGGALALAVAGVPRGTADVDVNVFLPESSLPKVFALLRQLGMDLDDNAATVKARSDGMFIARWDGMRIDVFLPSIPFAKQAEHTRVRMKDEAGWSGWFLSAEAIAVFKLLFFRGKDMVDLERLVAVRGRDLDHASIRHSLVEMMGEEDPRVQRWDQIVTRFAPT